MASINKFINHLITNVMAITFLFASCNIKPDTKNTPYTSNDPYTTSPLEKNTNKADDHSKISIQSEGTCIDSTKSISFKEFKLIFTKFNKEFNMWYNPKLIVHNDTLSIMGLPIENGSELSIKKSPNENYFVLDNIIKGYVEDDNGNKILHENYTCVIISVKEAKVEQFLQSECDGTWNDRNEWISSDNVIFFGE